MQCSVYKYNEVINIRKEEMYYNHGYNHIKYFPEPETKYCGVSETRFQIWCEAVL